MDRNLQAEERRVVIGQLIPEFHKLFLTWNDEYSSQARDLGAIGETVNLWRKAKRVKAAMIDGVDTVGWREPLRVILFELICHTFLLLFDLDKRAEAELTQVSRNAKRAMETSVVPGMVPKCGHPRCIEHEQVPYNELDDVAKALYQMDTEEEKHDASTDAG